MYHKKTAILMVGPSPDGLGGISRVVKTWRDNNLFKELGITYISTSNGDTSGKLIIFIAGFLRFLTILGKAKLVYIHTSSNRSFFRKSFFLLVCYLFSVRTVLHIHPTHYWDFLKKLKGVKRWYAFRILNRANTFVTLSEDMKKKMASLFPEITIHTLVNPVDVQALQYNENIARDDHRLLYLGSYFKEKGIYDLVDAIKILVEKGHNVKLDFYGGSNIETLRDYVSKKDLTQYIKVNGWINGEKKLRALYSCTLLILPSHSEGLPNVILEAMATKTPIVSTLVGGLKELLKDSHNSVISKTGDVNDLSSKIDTALNDNRLRNLIAENAYREILSSFDIRILKPKIMKIVREGSKY